VTIEAIDPLQRYGYVRVYRFLVGEYNQSTAYVYGVMEWLAQVSEKNGRPMSPSLEWIAKQADVSERTVQRALGVLKDGGWIDWETEGKTNHYVVKRVQYDTVDGSQIGHGQELTVDKMSTHGSQNVQQVRSSELIPSEEGIPPIAPQDTLATFADLKDGFAALKDGFAALWAGYPAGKKGPKMLAEVAWKKLAPDEQAAALAALPLWCQSRKWREGYVRECHRWLRYREFADEIPGGVEPAQNGRSTMAETEDLRESVRYLRQQAAGGVYPPVSPSLPAPQQEGRHS
jgi:DNA-binding transcriptional regulator YhcF (GntR family)